MESILPHIDSAAGEVKKPRLGASARRPEPAIHAQRIDPNKIDPDAVKVLRRLRRSGHTAYLVGGGVRDLLLDRSPKDFDIATSAKPPEVRSLFRNCRVIGRRFRLAHILFAGGKIIEVATFRKAPLDGLDDAEGELAEELNDVEAPLAGQAPATPRRPAGNDADLLIRHDNVFGDPYEDALRRDFTINGLFYDIDRGEVIDYVGGMPDVRARLVRTIGSPAVRFREDPVRILRAIKFSARLDLGIAPDVYDAMVDQRGEIRRAAEPRVFEEVLRLLRGGAAHRSVYIAWDTGVLSVVLPELAAFLDDDAVGCESTWGRLLATDRRVRAGALPSDAVLMAALLQGLMDEAVDGSKDPSQALDDLFRVLGTRLAMSRRLKDRLRLIALAQRRLRAGQVGGLARRDFFAEAALLHALDREARGEQVPDRVGGIGSQERAGREPRGFVRKPRRRRSR